MANRISLQPHQSELLIASLKYLKDQLLNGSFKGAEYRVSGNYTANRIEELIEKIDRKEQSNA